MKSKRIRIGIPVLLLLLLICGCIYTLRHQHPEFFVRQDEILTRGEFAAMLVQSIPSDIETAEKEIPSFSDIDGHWAEKDIETLIDIGILDAADYPDGYFYPDEPITRAEIIRMLVRVRGLGEEAKNTQGHSGYGDQDDIRDEDKGYFIIGREAGIIRDTDDGEIHPNDPVTKEEAEDMIGNITPEPSDSPEATPYPSESDEDQALPTPGDPDNDTANKVYYYPEAQIRFEIPKIAHTDDVIQLMPVWKYTKSHHWTLTKTAIDGSQQLVELEDEVNSTLGLEGGAITFKQDGEYTLTAVARNIIGKETVLSKQITVYPIPSISLSAPQIWYTGEEGLVNVAGSKLENLTAEWTIAKDDGIAEVYSGYASGALSSEGGSLVFPSKGQYELTLTMTDPTGRSFVRSRSFTVFPIPQLNIGLPALSYSGEPITVTASGTELDGLDIDWFLSVDASEPRPYAQLAAGSLSMSGGDLRIDTDRTVPVKLIAEATDTNGRKFTFISDTGTIKPIPTFPFTMPSSVHIGSSIDVSLPTIYGLEGRTLTWSLTKNDEPAVYSGNLSNSGGSIIINSTGDYILNTYSTDEEGREFCYFQSVDVTNSAPNKPTGSATVTRTAQDGKLFVNLIAYASDPDGDSVILEYTGNSDDGYYPVGPHTVQVRAKDAWGLYSDWTNITFTVTNSAPTTPIITRTPDGNSIAPGTAITITAASTDPDGDAITYIWEGRPEQTSTEYPLGKNVVRVKAVDATGAESPWAAIVFFIADPNKGGGMILTGPESVIVEQGISGATITNYTFTVPPVQGHSGQDFGRVRGYNVLTGQWDQLDYGTTTNGITFSRNLSPGIYIQLEFYYYTNHQCMYNKSNITYSVTFYFE